MSFFLPRQRSVLEMEPDAQLDPRSVTLTFNLPCREPRAWLVLRGAYPTLCVVEMRQLYPNVQSASVELPPGEYFCRYYSGDDRNLIYRGPAHIDGGVDRGMDTVVSVKAAEGGTGSAFPGSAGLPT